jgi:hypothetical protein
MEKLIGLELHRSTEEATYMEAFRGMPEYWREVVEGN